MNGEKKILHIYEKYYRLMLYIAKQVLKDHALAEDAVSDSIEKLIRNIHKVGDVSCYKTKSFVVIIVRNTALNILKKQGRTDSFEEAEFEKIPDRDSDIPDEIISAEGYNNLVDMINQLPDSLRDVAILSLVHGQSHEEIAETLEISYDAVKMRLSRAKKTIRLKLEGGCKHER